MWLVLFSKSHNWFHVEKIEDYLRVDMRGYQVLYFTRCRYKADRWVIKNYKKYKHA